MKKIPVYKFYKHKYGDELLVDVISYEKMIRSKWAEKHGKDNTPDDLQLAALINLCWKLGEPLREVFGPIYVNSGFRSEEVNAGVHGVGNSKHLSGEAMDIRIDSVEQGKVLQVH